MLFVNLNSGINIHQQALAEAMYDVLGNEFVFIETSQNANDGIKGVNKNEEFYTSHPYVLRMHESEATKLKVRDLIAKADAMRVGGSSFSLALERIKIGKLTFRSSERLFKAPLVMHSPATLYQLWKSFGQNACSNYRLLCQSAYLANDVRLFGNYKEKCYKFAYFTRIPKLNIDEVIQTRSSDKVQIVWCARFIEWKHPELPLKLARKLLESGRNNFKIKMIGADDTKLWHIVKQQIAKEQLEDYVMLMGGLPNAEVLELMRTSHIFIFTSDRNEGWGAVLNEAMGAGCACVASNEIGSVPFLLKHTKNGLIFTSKSAESLFENVSSLYDNHTLCGDIGKKAYQTITTEWSAKTAAERLVQLSESILSGDEIIYDDGPCSKAYPCDANGLI